MLLSVTPKISFGKIKSQDLSSPIWKLLNSRHSAADNLKDTLGRLPLAIDQFSVVDGDSSCWELWASDERSNEFTSVSPYDSPNRPPRPHFSPEFSVNARAGQCRAHGGRDPGDPNVKNWKNWEWIVLGIELANRLKNRPVTAHISMDNDGSSWLDSYCPR